MGRGASEALAACLLAGALITLTVMVFGGPEPMLGPRAGVVRGGDLLAFWDGGAIRASAEPERLYDPDAAREVQRALFPGARHVYRMAYPPPVYQATARLVPLGYVGAVRLLMVLTALTMALGAATLARSLPADVGPPRWVTAALIGASPAGLILLGTGQLSGLWLACVGVGTAALLGRREWVAGAALGLLVAKPSLALPALAAVVLLLRWRAALGFALGAGALVLGSVLVDGVQPWLSWAAMQAEPGDLALRMWNFPSRQLTLRSALGMFAERRSEAATALGTVGLALGTVGLLAVARLAVVPWRRDDEGARRALGFGAVLSMALLTTPHLFDYDVVMHAPGWLGSLWWLATGRARRPRLGAALLLGAWLAPVFGPVAASTHVAAGTLLIVAWVVWMASELAPGPTPSEPEHLAEGGEDRVQGPLHG